MISTLGTSPGGIAEIVMYLRRRGFDVRRVIAIRTRSLDVESAFKVLKLLLWTCVDRSIEVRDVVFDKEDVESQNDVRRFEELVMSVLKDVDVSTVFFDATGGRKAMSIALALIAMRADRPMLLAQIPHEKYSYIASEVEKIVNNYDVDVLLERFEQGLSLEKVYSTKELLDVKRILCEEIVCKDVKMIVFGREGSNINVKSSPSDLLREARELLGHAHEEYEKFMRSGDLHHLRDCAEKAWSAVVQAVNALLLAYGYDESHTRSHRARRQALAELEERDRRIVELGLRDKYGARERFLHELCFYEGECSPEVVRRELDKVSKLVDEVEGLVSKETRR